MTNKKCLMMWKKLVQAYKFIERFIKEDFADRDDPNKEIDHFLVPIFYGKAFVVHSSKKFKKDEYLACQI